jgi:hypothetical protein
MLQMCDTTVVKLLVQLVNFGFCPASVASVHHNFWDLVKGISWWVVTQEMPFAFEGVNPINTTATH